MGSGGSLQLQAMNEEPIPEDKRLKIAQHGVEVATGHYGFRLTTAPGDGLYVNYGLNKHVDVMQGGELHVSRTTIGGDLVNSGTVRMNRTGASPGNQLIVNGNYTGNNNGLIAFNTTLNGDESPTDKVIVTGDTRGSTRVVVNNIDGQGAQTDKGIELIEVNGDSAGSFALTSWVLYNWFNNTVESDHRQGDSYRSRGFTASLEAGYTFLIGELHGRAAVATGDFNWLTIQRGIQYSGNIGSGLCGSVSLHVFS